MSFRSVFLLRRSADLKQFDGTYDSRPMRGDGRETIVVSGPGRKDLKPVVAVLKSLGFEVRILNRDSEMIDAIEELTPLMIVSAAGLSDLPGYSLQDESGMASPFIYLRKPHPAHSSERVTGEKVLFPEQDLPDDSPEEPEEMACAHEADESEAVEVEKDEDSSHEPFDADSESESMPRSGSEEVEVCDDLTGLPRGDLVPPGPDEDYSIIGKIDAEEIARLSERDVLSETADSRAPENLYEEARSYVLDSIRSVDAGRMPDLAAGEVIAESIVTAIEAGTELLLAATDRGQEFAISSHSVNTAVFAVRIGGAMRLSRWQQLRIALAALLHEIGVVRLPKQLIYKKEKPTLEEIKILRQRPIYSARALKEVESRYDWLPEVVGQVYERENGSGHPLGLTGREICEEAKIIGISDLFDACIHRRPYREALTGYQALFELTTDQARTFSDRIVKALIKSLSLFPHNEFVVLSTGEIGRVVEINLENLSRPVVEIMFDKEGKPAQKGEPVDLAQNPSLYISKAVAFGNLPSS